MRKSFIILLAFAFGLFVGLTLQFLTASAAPGQMATENGDTNGDGIRDLSDAIYILTWLFLEGPEPVSFEGGCSPRFADNGDGTVTDTYTGRMWLQSTADTNGDNIIDNEDKVTKEEASALAREFHIAGYDDWALPTTAEMASLVDISRRPSIDPVFDIGFSYWIGSTNGGDPCHGSNFIMNFEFGGFISLHDNYNSSVTSYVLLVRRP